MKNLKKPPPQTQGWTSLITCGLFFFQRGDTGIIAEVCTLLAELHISVVEISQTIMEGTFTMIMLTQWTAGAPEFDVVQSRIAAKGDEMGLSIRMQRQDIFTAMHTI